ncbi:hypothetical protein FRB96_000660 [Tulasnella sp. 330]|nr:hypothetical protein FRB96_000660 [Tulasnella sp. 330]KAG8881176.1 hypothetical protein FRB97_009807 [Tulasnella sp. 331]
MSSTCGVCVLSSSTSPNPNFPNDTTPLLSSYKVPRSYSATGSRSRSPRRRQPQTRQPLVLPTVAQIPPPTNRRAPPSSSRKTKRAFDLTSRNDSRSPGLDASSPERRLTPRPAYRVVESDAPRGRTSTPAISQQATTTSSVFDKVWSVHGQPLSSTASSNNNSPKSTSLPIWRDAEHERQSDDEDSDNRIITTARAPNAWLTLIGPPTSQPSPKGKGRALHDIQPSLKKSLVNRISLLAASVSESYTTQTTFTSRRPANSRSQSLSPYSSSSASLSDSSGTSRSPSSSAYSSASTQITEPDLSPCSSRTPSLPGKVLRTRASTNTLLSVRLDSPSPSSPSLRCKASLLPAWTIANVPKGRDPLTSASSTAFYWTGDDRNAEVEPSSTSSDPDSPHPHSRLRALFTLAWALSLTSGTGKLMLDSYSSYPTTQSPAQLQSSPSTDSLGLCLPPKSTIGIQQQRRKSSASLSSLDTPILYHHHAKPPRIQARKQAFGPLDVKPYGYRVGVKEVMDVFGHYREEIEVMEVDGRTRSRSRKSSSSSEDALATPNSFFDFFSPMMSEEVLLGAGGGGTIGRGSCGAFGSALSLDASASVASPVQHRQTKKAKVAAQAREKRSFSSPPSTVTLQRYPIIPYNPPPGGGVGPDEEVFPKVRQTALWWKHMVPGGEDGNIDASVPLSNRSRSLSSTPGRGRGRVPSPPEDPAPQARFARDRSPSPQRGRARCVSVRVGLLSSTGRANAMSPVPVPSPALAIPKRHVTAAGISPRPALSSRYFRPPPEPLEMTSTYLVWALRGTILGGGAYSSSSNPNTAWPAAVAAAVRPTTPSVTQRKAGGGGKKPKPKPKPKMCGLGGREGRTAKGGQALNLKISRRGRTEADYGSSPASQMHACMVGSLLRWEWEGVDEDEDEDEDEAGDGVLHQRFGVDLDCDNDEDMVNHDSLTG